MANSYASGPPREVTFIAPTGAMEIRMMDVTLDNLVQSARTLRARFFIVTGRDNEGLYLYGTTKSQVGGYFRPVKMFAIDQREGAAMYALMLQGRS